MPQAALGVVLALLVGLLVGCGSASKPKAKKKTSPPTEQFLGQGADMVWVYRTREQPRSVVIFLHGLGGPSEDRPDNHRPWLEHLARNGSAVLYPRYEVGATPDVMVHVLNGVQAGMERLDVPNVPAVVIGYSRGGRLAIEYAAVASRYGRAPLAVLSVFPSGLAPEEPPVPLDTLDPKLRLTIMVGDSDTVVGGEGARDALRRLRAAGFPPERIKVIAVHSKGDFTADHLAPLQTTAAAKKAFWTPADRIVDAAR
jgi:pimeloyl-ACP methyl ester carboxylesterase